MIGKGTKERELLFGAAGGRRRSAAYLAGGRPILAARGGAPAAGLFLNAPAAR